MIDDELNDGVGRSLAQAAAVNIDATHARVGGKGDEVSLVLRNVAAAQVVCLLGEHDYGAALRGFVRQTGELRRIRQLCAADSFDRQNSTAWRLPRVIVPVLSRSKRIDVARRFYCFAAHRQHIVLNHAIHAGDADGGKQSANGSGNQANQK